MGYFIAGLIFAAIIGYGIYIRRSHTDQVAVDLDPNGNTPEENARNAENGE